MNPTPLPDNTGAEYGTNKKDDPRILAFKTHYLDSKSPTFMNVLQSALKAGYSYTYACNISVQQPKWWKELQESSEHLRASMLHKAERNLNKYLEDDKDKATQSKVTLFVSERLGKEHYASRQELTDKGGRRLFSDKSKDVASIALSDLFKGVQQP